MKPQLLCATGWNSQVQCADTLFINMSFNVKIAIQYRDKVELRTSNLIHIDGLVAEEKHLQKQLGQVPQALDSLQSDTGTDAVFQDNQIDLMPKEELIPYS